MENLKYSLFIKKKNLDSQSVNSKNLYAESLQRIFSEQNAISNSSNNCYYKANWHSYKQIEGSKIAFTTIYLTLRLMLAPMLIKDKSISEMVTYHPITKNDNLSPIRRFTGWSLYSLGVAMVFIAFLTILISAFSLIKGFEDSWIYIVLLGASTLLFFIANLAVRQGNKMKSVSAISTIEGSSPFTIVKLEKMNSST